MKHRQHNQKYFERKYLCFIVWQGQICADGVNEALSDFLFIKNIGNSFEFIA